MTISGQDSLPDVFDKNKSALIGGLLQKEAAIKSTQHPLPGSKAEWSPYRTALRDKIIKETGALVNQKLPLDMIETRHLKRVGFTIHNIAFQTRPKIYATANLYVPDGEGKFPAVIVMMGHSFNGRFYENYQMVGTTLAMNGYVALCIDPWGSGERTTYDGIFEDHGDENNLGASLMDVGETLMGMQITDNIRGVDLLSSLPYVMADHIGATGSSGGGNQTIWLTAMDNRIKAAVPVVSAGTYASFVMGTPCICEILPDALTFTEESGTLGLIAPAALKMCNHTRDANAAFNPREMLKSYALSKPVFDMLGAGDNISYTIFDLPHGYYPEDRAAMLKWFNTHLKGLDSTAPLDLRPLPALPVEELRVYPVGKRPATIASTQTFCQQKGTLLRANMLEAGPNNRSQKRVELKKLLGTDSSDESYQPAHFTAIDGWDRFSLETSGGKSIPLLVREPSGSRRDFILVCDPSGKKNMARHFTDSLAEKGLGVAIIDLSGTGETSSSELHSADTIGRLRTYTKSSLLLGSTVMGEWVKEIETTLHFIRSAYKPSGILFYGSREAGLAGLFANATGENIKELFLKNTPVSYLFGNRDSIEYFSTAVHVPGILNWGDITLAAALGKAKMTFSDPVDISGTPVKGKERAKYQQEFNQLARRYEKKESIALK